MKKHLFIALTSLSMLSTNAWAQNVSVGGVVKDSNNEPLIGAAIKVVGTNTGVQADADGKFRLECAPGAELEISYLGYTTKKIKSGTNMIVTLDEDVRTLDVVTVVGVGYGKMRRSDLTGAITSVSAKDMKKGVVTSTEQLLQGKVAGLSVVQASGSPENGASLRLRGGTSLSASNGPLIVVDGIAGVDINSVQPHEIVSIDVLKDASAAAIYGSRGANGVIIVTTNREASDVESKTMEYNGYVAIANVAKSLDMLSANQWRGYVRDNNVASALDYGADTDWQDQIYRTAISHNHNLSFSNSRKQSGYRASLSYQNTQGVVKRNDMDRLAASLSAYQVGLGGRLRLDAGVNANVDKWHPLDTRIFERTLNLNPTFPVHNADGSYAQLGGTNTENPVEINNNRTDDHKRHRLLGYGKAELEIIDGLKAVANVSYEYNQTTGGTYKPKTAMMEGASLQGWGQRAYAEYNNKQLEAYLTYDKTIADAHRINAMAGYSYLATTAEGFGATRSGYTTDFFGYNNLGAGTNAQLGDVYSYKNKQQLISFYGRVNYSYKSRYMATATLRRDGSSVFGTNNKWGTFPSLSLAWRASEEDFLKNVKWLDNLKLRAGFGVTGNQSGIGAYQSVAVLTPSGAAYFDGTEWKNSYVQTRNTNPDLKWESTQQWNVGIDFGLFQKLRGTLEFYHKKTTDLLWTYPVPQPPYIVGTMLANAGDMVNKGFELTLGYNILRTRDFTLDANLSLSYNHQEITKLNDGIFQLSEKGVQAGSLHNIRGLSGVYSQYIREGYAAGSFFGPRCTGIDENGNYILETDAEGNVTEHYLGSAQPKWNLGLSINATYKNLDLNISGYGMMGHKVLNATRMQLFDSSRLPAQNVLDDYLSSGVKGTLVYSDYFLEKANFFRLQNITLGYTIPGTQRAGFGKIRVYVTAENLLCLTGYKGTDPEVSIPDNVLNGPGIDRLVTDNDSGNGATYSPRPRTYSLGVNISF